MSKDISFSGKQPSQNSSRAAEAFAGLEPPPEPTKRLTVDLPQSLHSRVKFKLNCVRDNISIAEVVRTLLDTRFPKENI